MKPIIKSLILMLSIALALTACDNRQKPEHKDNTQTQEEGKTEEGKPSFEGFEGYSFVLDQGPVDPKYPYPLSSTHPRARLLAISPSGELIRDVLAANDKTINLGYGCEMHMVNGLIFVFAKTTNVGDGEQRQQVTTINAKTLDVQQVKYDIDGQRFAAGINEHTAIIVDYGNNVYTLDLKEGNITQVIEGIDSEEKPIVANGKVFFMNYNTGAIDIHNGNQLTEVAGSIAIPQYPDYITQVADTMILAKTEDTFYLVSTESQKIVLTAKASLDGLDKKSFTYDSRTKRLYTAGRIKGENRDKIYVFDLTKPEVTRDLFYTLPASDVNTRMGFHGSIMMGINPVRDELYIAHLAGKEETKNPDGTIRDMRIGFLSRLSLSNPKKQAPYTEPDAKLRIDDVVEFSPIFFGAHIK